MIKRLSRDSCYFGSEKKNSIWEMQIKVVLRVLNLMIN